ncbi:CBS domain-containing protein [Ectothiorhodospiraceae bacterium BW-2]|nr:CBS domain-containing protein [Ectothiorhodospiraceae bacterium BW-2]
MNQAILDFLRQHAPFNQMESDHLNYLAAELVPHDYAQNRQLTGPEAGVAQQLFIIWQGEIRGLSADGERAEQLWELSPGELFPIGALLAGRPVRVRYLASQPSRCLQLPREAFETLRHLSAPFEDFCTRRMASLLDQTLQTIQQQSAHRITSDNRFNLKLSQISQRQPLTVAPDTPIQSALELMEQQHSSSVVTVNREGIATGLLSLHDLITRIILPKTDLQRPVGEIVTHGLITLTPDSRLYEAALLMARHAISHIPLLDSQQRLCGMVSERDLFTLQQVGIVHLSEAITRATTMAELSHIRAKMALLVEQMLAEGVAVEQLTSLISALNDRITHQLIELVQRDMNTDLPPFSWLSFGSEGRSEQTLVSDQDNGILFADSANNDAHRQRLLPFAKAVNQALDQCGFPLCKGNIMASNPDCCLSLGEWQQRFSRWIDQGTPQHLLQATIFFDMRRLYGEAEPVAQLRQFLLQKTANNSRFRQQMAALAMSHRPPLGVIRDFVLSGQRDAHPHTLDLKTQGVTPFVDCARIYTLAHALDETGTATRLRALAQAGQLRESDVNAWCDSYHFIQLLRLQLNQRQLEQGEEASNYLNPDHLNELERRILKEAFRQARKLQSKLALDYQL